MTSPYCRYGVVALVGVLLVLGSAAWAQPISVLVDGQPMATTAPPTEVGGRIMVGMRDIFERLGASVEWNATEQKITATRGSRVVILWIGRQYAMVDGATLPLDVPPTLIGGSTYVPVRFPSEALGADVTWMSATRTVMISTANMPPLGGGEPPPPPPGANEAAGTLTQVLQSTPRALSIQSYETGNPETYVARVDAVFQRGDSAATVLRLVNADELLPGDDVKLTLDANRQIQQVEARYKLVPVTYQAAAANSLLTSDGLLFGLAPDVKIMRTDTGEVSLASLQAGEKVTLRINPVTEAVWDITAPPSGGPPPPPPPGQEPQILMLAPEGYTRPLTAGETLTVKMTGTPGGQARFNIGVDIRQIEMTEEEPGVYRGQYRVAANEQQVDRGIRGQLKVGDKSAGPVTAAVRVSLDAVNPMITGSLPERGAELTTNQPTIQVAYSDGQGVGIDLTAVTLQVGGRDVTPQCIVTEEGLTYYSPALADGQHEVNCRVQDLAGNQTGLVWRFSINAGDEPAVIESVTHTPPGVVLGSGDTLTVTMNAQPRGRSANFEIVGLREGLPMQRQGAQNSAVWQGTYEVRAGDQAQQATIRCYFEDQNGKVWQFEDQQPVTINARLQTKLKITRPEGGAVVQDVFELAGTNIPNRKVYYQVTYEGRSRLLNARTTGTVAEGQVKAKADGTWSVQIDTTAARRNPLLKSIDRFAIECQLQGEGGRVIQEDSIHVVPPQ